MKNLFTSHKIALRLKHLGFDEPCFACFETNTEFHVPFIVGFDLETPKHFNQEENCIAVPFYQQVIDWIFENYDIDITIDAIFKNRIYYTITKLTNDGPKRLCGGSPYEPSSAMKTLQEAREVAILEAINIIEHETN